jgi:PAS domain S-box-containing protein|tara:strand:- start:157 stop:348 length:192 start_codon:yes stop_codon:yes gene_type:complete
VTALRKDELTFPMSLAVSVAEIGGEKKFIGIVRDITKQKETELKLQQAQKMDAIGQLIPTGTD